MLLVAHCGPSHAELLTDSGQRHRMMYVPQNLPAHLAGPDVDPDERSAAAPDTKARLSRSPNWIDRLGDTRLEPSALADLTDDELTAFYAAGNDSQAVSHPMRRFESWIDSTGQLHGSGWRIGDLPYFTSEHIAHAGLPVVGESSGWRMPELEPAAPYLVRRSLRWLFPEWPDNQRGERFTPRFSKDYGPDIADTKAPLCSRAQAQELLLEAMADLARDLAQIEALFVLANCGS